MIEEVVGFDALYESMCKCVRGVSWKDSVMHFELNALEEVMKLEKQLIDGTYVPREPKQFKITHPKPRDVVSVAFRDRVYQRSLNDNVIYPQMTRHFIYDNWACQKGKGTDAARDRLEYFLHKAYRKHGNDLYALQCDIHGYYPNMRHDVAEFTFQKYIESDVFTLAQEVMRSQYDGDVGYNPGSQMIQIAGISVLNDMDHYIKEQLHIKYYLRYMDDFILIHEDLEYLKECKERIAEYIEKIGFTFNEKKTKIHKLSDGIMFLGWKFVLTNTGKVLMLIDPKKIKEKKRMYKRLVAKSKRGEVPWEYVDMSYNSFRSNLSKGDTHNLTRRMDAFYYALWGDDNV